MQIYKRSYWLFLITGIISVGLGVGFLVKSDSFLKIVCYVIGISAIILGIYKVLDFILRYKHSVNKIFDPIVGTFSVIAGIILLFNPKFITDFFTVIIGIIIILSASFKLWNSFELKEIYFKPWWILFFLSLIGVCLGFVLAIQPEKAVGFILKILGIAFIVDGLETLSVVVICAVLFKKTKSPISNYRVIESKQIDTADCSDDNENK